MDNESWEKWFSDLEMDEGNLLNDEHDITINSLEEELKLKGESCCCSEPIFDSDFTTANNDNNMGNINININNIASSLEEKNTVQELHISSEKPKFSSSYCTLSFEDSTTTTVPNIPSKNSMKGSSRNSSKAQDHIIAERKRREKLSTMLIALSAIVPGLKKMDRLSIINNTIEHVKYLQNRVRDLEDQQNKKTAESVTCFKNNKPNNNNVNTVGDNIVSVLPNVDASVSGEDVIIRVICYKQKNIVTKLLSKLAAYDLSIVCSNVLPFGNSNLNISIVAKVEREFSMAMDDLVKILNEDLLKCCNLQQ